MSTFEVLVKPILDIEPHTNADSLEIAVIDGYKSIVKKGQFQKKELIVYIPEAAVLPEILLKELNLWDETKNKGKLAGSEGNRVKAIKLRAQLSQGICIKAKPEWTEGQNVADELGITKYEPPVPVAMQGEVFCLSPSPIHAFDVENVKRYPDMYTNFFVTVMEKLHGTFCGIVALPEEQSHPEAFGEKKNILIFSKGLGSRGLFFKNNEVNKTNLYVRTVLPLLLEIEKVFANSIGGCDRVRFLFGEIVGKGVQDLHYVDKPELFLFAYGFLSVTGFSSQQGPLYLGPQTLTNVARAIGCSTVPILNDDELFGPDTIDKYTSGKTKLGAGHIREGVVFWCYAYDEFSGMHPALKSVSEEYLLRNNGTEYN